VPTPVLKNGHPPVRASLDPDGRDVTVLRPIAHYNDQLIGTDLDGMLPPIQRTTFERSCNCITTAVSHCQMMPSVERAALPAIWGIQLASGDSSSR
jgi:hypothetical protein